MLQGSKFEASRFKVQGPRFRVEGTTRFTARFMIQSATI
jgi:hypothetical protein